MPLIEVEGISIEFPYEPYEVQKDYMRSVVQCVKEGKGKTALLESPTGTGKTVSLLCSAIAWIVNQNERSEDKESQLPDMSKLRDECKMHIIYASRTHSQLKEAIREFKATSYRKLPMVVLGSRELLCVYDPVKQFKTNNKMNTACDFFTSSRAIKKNKDGSVISDQRCPYHQGNVQPDFFHEPMDIEDLVKKSKDENVCPYFESISAARKALITFCPYDYVLHEAYRDHLSNITQENDHHIDLKNSILIFDEGHNIQSKFEDYASAAIDSKEIESCMNCIKMLINKNSDELLKSRYSSALESLGQLLHLINSHALKPSPDTEGIFEAEFSSDEVYNFLNQFGSISEKEFDPDEENVQIIALLKNITRFFDRVKIIRSHPIECFRLYLKESFEILPDSEHIRTRTLEFWCADSFITYERVKASGVHCIIITSGTLAPLSALKSEMGISDPIELMNSHVVDNHQVMSRIVMSGPDGVYFNSSYHRRYDEDYLNSLGTSILHLSNIAKHKGVLVVFPSYEMLDLCKKQWSTENAQGTSLWIQFSEKKEIYEEPRKNEEFEAIITKFKSCIIERRLEGAVLFGIFRGKVAEGLDLKDDYGRVVILIGIPYRPRSDPRLKFKLKYLVDNKKIDENQWHSDDAMRTANQAMGRVIRHIRDYGAIFLFDYRYRVECLPGWLRGITYYERRFNELLHQLEEFFNDVTERVNALHNLGQYHAGNYRSWEVRQAQREYQKIRRQNERLSWQETYLSSRINKLKDQEEALKAEIHQFEKRNAEMFQEFFMDDSDGPSAAQQIVKPGLSPQRSRKRLHSPEPPALS